MLSLKAFKKLLEKERSKLVDPDGFDLAFYDGAQHVVDFCGDGGLSEQYIGGIEWALANITEEGKYGFDDA